MRAVDIGIVTYAPDLALLGRLLASLAEEARVPFERHLFIEDNSADAAVTQQVAAIAEPLRGAAFDTVSVQRSGANLGFGRGHNAIAARGDSPYLLVLNQDCVLEPGALEGLLDAATASGPDIAAWEMRQIPYEHPKDYDPVSLETTWVSGAAS